MGEREGDWDGRERKIGRDWVRERLKKDRGGRKRETGLGEKERENDREKERQDWERKGERKDRKKDRVGEKQIGREP